MTSREERMQQRLRGALRREVKDVDFGLVFPVLKPKITVTSQPSPKESEASQTLPSFSQRNSLTNTPTEPDLNYSSRSKEEALNIPRKSGANTSKKRRKLDGDQTPSTTSYAPGSSQKTSSTSKNSVFQDNSISEVQISDLSSNSIEQISPGKRNVEKDIHSSHSPKLSKTPMRIRKTLEVTESPENAPGSGHRIHELELILPSSRSQILHKNKPRRVSHHTPLSSKNQVQRTHVKKSQNINISENHINQGHQNQPDDDDLDELSPERSFIFERKVVKGSLGSPKFPDNAADEKPYGNTDIGIDQLSSEKYSHKIKVGIGHLPGSNPSPDEAVREESSKTINNKHGKPLQGPSSRSIKTGIGHSSPITSYPVESSAKRPADTTDEDLDELSPVHSSQTKKAKTGRPSTIKPYLIKTSIREATQPTDQDLDKPSPEKSSHSKTDKIKHSMEPEGLLVNLSKNGLVGESELNGGNKLIGQNNPAEFAGHKQAVVNLNELKTIEINGIRAESPDLDMPVENAANNDSRGKSSKQKTQLRPYKKEIKSGSKKQKVKSYVKKSHDGSHVPITVHRLSTPVIYDDQTTDADILNMEMPHCKRRDVNCIDVLSHICQKIIEKKIRTLCESTDRCENMKLRRDYRTELQAIEAFGTELQDRLLEYALCLDNTHSLERRLRDEQRKKIKLRAEILQIRAEREQVALRIDEIRTEHEKAQDEYLKINSVNNAIHDLELAMEMGRNTDPESAGATVDVRGTEAVIKKVAQHVSSQSTTGGLLRHVKEFNSFLERTAVTLEARVE